MGSVKAGITRSFFAKNERNGHFCGCVIECHFLDVDCNSLQLRIYKTPDLETPTYQILKRTANYEVCPSFLEMIGSTFLT